ncbi:hypothetical protein [Streptomyces phaeochromogenes]|uniref:hypothetical protein n=1 Tax=Streptomyces phaeochromogenes TaxID=1923 RepID=UPI002DDC87C2|nr:hypothetical protein [Streptomyces phaeochromogenes]WRZ34659.1 hypothetical protein OG931_46455 [Streptomyces phaeochromogenes]
MPIMGGVLATYSYITPLLSERAGVPESVVPLALIVFGARPWEAPPPVADAPVAPARAGSGTAWRVGRVKYR